MVMVLMLLCLVFFALLQVAHLYTAQLINHHAAFVSGRSYVVGFRRGVVKRAQEVGSIGMAGAVTGPDTISGLSVVELGTIEPVLVRQLVEQDEHVVRYEHWPKISLGLPVVESEIVQDFNVRVRNYPVEFPMRRAFLADDSVDFRSRVSLYNHAAYYLE
jgi:hypothetical protein